MRLFTWGIIACQLCLVANLSGAIKGKVTRNTYTSPGNVFKMTIPNQNNVKQQIDDYTDGSETTVTFRNDFGNNIQVRTYEGPYESIQALQQPDNKENFISAMDQILQVFLDTYNFPSTEIVKKEYFYDPAFGHAVYRVVKTCGHSGVVNVEKGKECDATTGFLLTASDHHIVMIIIQESPVNDYIAQLIKQHTKSGAAKDTSGDLRDQLVGVRRSIVFPKNTNSAFGKKN